MNIRLPLGRLPAMLLLALLAALVLPVPAGQAQDANGEIDADTVVAPEAQDADDADAAERLWQQVRDRRSRIRIRAFDELLARGDAVVPEALARLDDADVRVRLACVRLLARLAPPTALEPLVQRLDDEAEVVRDRARIALLSLPVDDLAGRLEALAERWLAEHGYTPIGLDRLVLVLRLREVLAEFEVWRTPMSPSGIRFPNQYATVLRDRPQAAAVLIQFLQQHELSDDELGGTWTVGEALVAAIRALADAPEPPEGARAAIVEFLRRRAANSPRGSLYYLTPPATGTGNRESLIAVAQLALARMGSPDVDIQQMIDRWERSLANFPNSHAASSLAMLYIELGDTANARHALRIAVRLERLTSMNSRSVDNPYIHLHLAALTLQELTELEAAGIDPREAHRENERHDDGLQLPPNAAAAVRGQVMANLDQLATLDQPISEELAMQHMRMALERGFSDAQWLAIDPRLERLRRRDDFQQYIETLRRIYGPAAADSADQADEGGE